MLAKRHIHVGGIALLALLCSIVPSYLYQSYGNAGTKSVRTDGGARVLFVGDMMFDRTIRDIAEEKGYEHLFSCIKGYLGEFDMVVGNLEGPITGEQSRSRGTKPGDPGNTSFTFARAVAGELARHNIVLVNVGNNHIYDFGSEGLRETKQALDSHGVSYFGDPSKNAASARRIGSQSVAFVSFNQFIENDPESTIEEIRNAENSASHTVVYAHWGEEYSEEGAYQRSLAHRFVDAGADLVIGSHPHVIQGREAYRGKDIFYSLGNFIFDQYWMESVRKGSGVEAAFSDGGIEAKEVFFDILRDGTTCKAS